jgi:hypothetical protein
MAYATRGMGRKLPTQNKNVKGTLPQEEDGEPFRD